MLFARYMIRVAATLLFACCEMTPILAQELMPGIIGDDERQLFTARGHPWDAIGQVNATTYRILLRCTGTLLAPNLVVTAAHCVINPLTNLPFAPASIHFLAGVRGSINLGDSAVRCLRFLPDFRYVPPEQFGPSEEVTDIGFFRTDVVILELDRDLTVRPASLISHPPEEPGIHLTHIGYPADHRFMPWGHSNCHLLRPHVQGELWAVDCDTHSGSSGGPIFVQENGEFRLTAIMTAGFGRLFNLALPSSVWSGLLNKASCAKPP